MKRIPDYPLISVIIPVFNKERFMDACIESVVCQTYNAIEILLIDDGSTDSSGEKCDGWLLIDPRVKVTHTKNNGVSAARNMGLKLSKGQFITFVDADDTLASNAIETMYRGISADKVDMWTSYLDKELWEWSGRYYSKYLLNKRKTAVWGCIFKSDIAKSARFPEELINNEDFVYLYYISRITNRVAGNHISKRNVYKYNQSDEQSLCKQASIGRVNSTLRAVQYVEKITPDDLRTDFELFAFNMYVYVLSNCPYDNTATESLVLSKKDLGRYLREHYIQWAKCPMRASGMGVVKATCCALFPLAYSRFVSFIKGVGNGK